MTTIRVQFPMTQEVWAAVVENAQADEAVNVIFEAADAFVVEYPDTDAWQAAQTRFEGLVEYQHV